MITFARVTSLSFSGLLRITSSCCAITLPPQWFVAAEMWYGHHASKLLLCVKWTWDIFLLMLKNAALYLARGAYYTRATLSFPITLKNLVTSTTSAASLYARERTHTRRLRAIFVTNIWKINVMGSAVKYRYEQRNWGFDRSGTAEAWISGARFLRNCVLNFGIWRCTLSQHTTFSERS